jgi:hypothetical protein
MPCKKEEIGEKGRLVSGKAVPVLPHLMKREYEDHEKP